MFCESLLKYKGIHQETAIAEALKYQKHEVKGFTRYLCFREKLSQSSKENLLGTHHTYIK